MPKGVSLPRRHSVRLSAFDYSSPSAYFLTICTQDMRRLFGDVVGHTVALNSLGQIVDLCWREIPSHFVGVKLAPHVLMPNHVHGIVRLLPHESDGERFAKHPRRAQHAVPLRPEAADPRRFGLMVANSIPAVVRSFKSAVASRIRLLLQKPEFVVWQRGYYEHVIRNEDDFRNTCEYIRMNPTRWQFDKGNA